MVPIVDIIYDKVIDQTFSANDIVSIVLEGRQITDQLKFLNPPFPAFNLKLASAVSLVKKCITNKKNILIYGDYDVDGITATAILWQVLHQKNALVTPYIPHREKDGYGFRADSFLRFQQEKNLKFDLLITVDNGIVAQKEFQKILQHQVLKIIVIDHHLADKTNKLSPKNCLLIHSTEFSGSALSWFFSREFDQNADLGLAALGTIADCLPLTGVNRSLVTHGLLSLRLNPSPGIKQLIKVSGVKQDSVSTYDLGYILGPRINAIGRLSDPTDALRLLCSQNLLQAARYAQVLNSYNQDRQVLQKDSLEFAENYLSRDTLQCVSINKKNKLLFISDPTFAPGIIGLIAGRLTEKYHLPSVVISKDEKFSKGSCRSIACFNIIEALRIHSDLFVDLGGHAGAAGFSIKTANIPKLKKLLTATIKSQLANVDTTPIITVDAVMKLSVVKIATIKALEQLSPFGIGNPEPLFLFKNLKIVSKKVLGSNGDHLKLKLDDPDSPKVEYLAADAIAFKKGGLDSSLKVGDLINIVASLSANTWNNTTTPQLMVKEIIKS